MHNCQILLRVRLGIFSRIYYGDVNYLISTVNKTAQNMLHATTGDFDKNIG